MEDISVQQLRERLDRGETFHFIDVRNPDEYEADNLGARLMPLGDLPDRMEELNGLQDEEIIIHCRSGARSGRAKEFLESQGFHKVRNVPGGILAYRELK